MAACINARAAFCILVLVMASGQIAPATDTTFTVKAAVNSKGKGSSQVGSVSLQSDAGTAQFLGHNYKVVAYVSQLNWAGFDLFDLLAVREDGKDVALLYLYCSPAGGGSREGLSTIWYESYYAKMASEQASGSCQYSTTETSVHAAFPAIVAVPNGGTVTSFSMTGDATLDSSGVGKLRAKDGSLRTFTPFQVVDCSSCPGGPWYELHSIFDQRPDDACFGIIYLFPNDPQRISLEYSLCFPTMISIDSALSGSWSGRPSAASERMFEPSVDMPWRLPLSLKNATLGSSSPWIAVV